MIHYSEDVDSDSLLGMRCYPTTIRISQDDDDDDSCNALETICHSITTPTSKKQHAIAIVIPLSDIVDHSHSLRYLDDIVKEEKSEMMCPPNLSFSSQQRNSARCCCCCYGYNDSIRSMKRYKSPNLDTNHANDTTTTTTTTTTTKENVTMKYTIGILNWSAQSGGDD
jgi:hypothetical protein